MKITLIARDVAPSQALALLATTLTAKGHEPIQFLGNGNTLTSTAEEREQVLLVSQAVVVGMSSSVELSAEECGIARLAKEASIPVFFYADSFGTYNRPWFRDLLSDSSLFVISKDEAEKARIALPDTVVIVTGSPMQEKFFFPKRSRDQIRRQLDLTERDKMVLIPGGKDTEINLLHFSHVIEKVWNINDVKVIISLHGGDKTDLRVYEDRFISIPRVRIIPEKEMSGSDLLPGADVVVGSATTLGVEAICAGIPTVDYLSESARARYRKATGQDTWEPCVQKVAFDMTKDEGVLSRILNGTQDLVPSRAMAKALYPKPEKVGEAVEKMISAIELVI